MGNVALGDISNYSNAFNSKYFLLLQDRPKTEFWLKELTIPGITLNSEEVTREPYPIKIEGNVQTFGDLDLTVFVDENFKVYEELYNWFQQAITGTTRPIKNGTIGILNNQMNKIVMSFEFQDLFLTSLPAIPYDNFSSEPITLSLTLAYTKFTPTFNL